MPKLCENCRHFTSLARTIRNECVGECHRRAPGTNFGWPRVRAADYCSEWETGEAGPAPGLPLATPAPSAAHAAGELSLSLDDGQAAPTPSGGESPSADAPRNTGPRRAKAAQPRPAAPAPSATGPAVVE